MNTRALLVALVLAGFGAFLLVVYLRRFEEEASGGAKVSVLIATRAIKRGETITEDMLAPRAVPMAYVEDRAVKASEKGKIVGLPVGNQVDANQTIMWTDMAFASDKKRDLSSLVQPGNRALSIKAMNGDKSFALIRPGDYVDVIANVPDGDGMKRSSLVLLQRVLVLAVGTDTTMPGLDDEKVQEKLNTQELLLTLSVSLREAQLLALALKDGELSVAVRNPTDQRLADVVPELKSSALTSKLGPRFNGPAPVKGPEEVKEQ